MRICLLLASLTLVASSAFAQQAPKAAAPAAAPVLQGPPTTPLPAGAKIAFVNIPYIVGNSAEGKADNVRVEALVKKKQAEAAANKNAAAAQKLQQDAIAEVQKLQTDLQNDFQRKLMPVLQQMAQDRKLSLLFSSQDAGLIWAEPGLDLTAEAIKRFDAAMAGTRR